VPLSDNDNTICRIRLIAIGGSTTGEYAALAGYSWSIIKITRKSNAICWTEFAIRCEDNTNHGHPRVLLRSSYINGESRWYEIALSAV
jgi:hypothetical protein